MFWRAGKTEGPGEAGAFQNAGRLGGNFRENEATTHPRE